MYKISIVYQDSNNALGDFIIYTEKTLGKIEKDLDQIIIKYEREVRGVSLDKIRHKGIAGVKNIKGIVL